jgi:hypothetical protein
VFDIEIVKMAWFPRSFWKETTPLEYILDSLFERGWFKVSGYRCDGIALRDQCFGEFSDYSHATGQPSER